MISREQIVQLLGSLPDDKLLQALSVATGAQQGGGGFDALSAMSAGGGQDDPGNQIQPWSQKQVPFGGGQDRPQLLDKAWAKPPGQPPAGMKPQGPAPQPNMGQGDGNPYLQSGGC